MATRIKNVDEIINSSGTVTLKIDEAATTADLTQMKNDILGGATAAYDTLQEIEAYITQNNTDVGSLLTNMGTKYDKSGGAISGNVNISGTMSVGAWTMEVVSNELVFKYNGTKVAKIGTNGLITSANDLAAFGTV